MTATFDSIAAWQHERRRQLQGGVTLGLVPTMGALHEGHLSLVRRSRSENDRTLVSIFVNAKQFSDHGDLALYPRTVDEDLALLSREGTDFVLLPSDAALYPDAFRYRVVETERSKTLEGAHRPGHFDAVLTVVLKLLQIARADRAYFGEKDWQQLSLVRGMAEAFFLPTEIVACPTVRTPEGVARSSRNRRLSPADLGKAAALNRALLSTATVQDASDALRAAGFVVEYVEEQEGRRLAAVRLGEVRLIDNVSVIPGKHVEDVT